MSFVQAVTATESWIEYCGIQTNNNFGELLHRSTEGTVICCGGHAAVDGLDSRESVTTDMHSVSTLLGFY